MTDTRTVIKLPPPRANSPILTRMMSDSVENGPPLVWILAKEHPLNNGWQIRRMFVDSSGVEVYSVSPDGQHGIRNLVPMSRVRLVEEAMSLEVFVEELAVAEEDDDDDDSDLEPEPEAPLNVTTQNEQA